ncbi:MAG: outer membrane lipoprotein-sorting protein [Pseudomonadota bacterium]
MNHRNAYPLCFAAALLIAVPASAFAESPEEKGLRLSVEAEQFDNGFGDFTAEMEMVLRNRSGQESTRRIRSRTLEVQGDGDKSMSIFDEPADVKGTAMLTFTHGLEPDDQWLYLPALKRVKRISSRNKSGPFMGSEFAFEDLGSQEVEKYTYKYVGEEPCGDWTCHVIERFPEYKHSGYTRQVVWMDTDAYRVTKTEFYDRKKALLKTLTMADYAVYADRHWRPSVMEMVNHQTGKSTTLKWNDYQFKTGLKDSDFNKNKLKNLR